jgi:aryl-alcohol dehydrogenase-like predicted oxidoreductase
MSYGGGSDPAYSHAGWVLDERASRPFYRAAIEAGINFFDTANVYGAGHSEEILGRAVRDLTLREEVVIATKVRGPMTALPNNQGLSRKHIMTSIDASLRRLGTDHVDLFQIHRWDYAVPIEETMEALHDVIRAGKALYIGASSMFAWQFANAQHVAELNGWTRFISMQPQYNLIYREEEREMLPLCRDQGVGRHSVVADGTGLPRRQSRALRRCGRRPERRPIRSRLPSITPRRISRWQTASLRLRQRAAHRRCKSRWRGYWGGPASRRPSSDRRGWSILSKLWPRSVSS